MDGQENVKMGIWAPHTHSNPPDLTRAAAFYTFLDLVLRLKASESTINSGFNTLCTDKRVGYLWRRRVP
jgi:hypothetical protein